MKLKRTLTFSLIFIFLLSVSQIANAQLPYEGEPEDWLTGWEYRKSHVIIGSNGSGVNYQIRFNVHYGSGSDSGENVYLNGYCRSDFGDVRFTGSDGVTLYDMWIEEMTVQVNCVFWVEVKENLNSDRTIYIYFGKSDEITTQDGYATFISAKLSRKIDVTNYLDVEYRSGGDICKLQDDILFGTFREGTTHTSVDGIIRYVTSSDYGESWSGISTIYDNTANDRDAHMPCQIEFKDNGVWTLIVIWWDRDNNYAHFTGHNCIRARKSTDGGSTWGEVIDIEGTEGYWHLGHGCLKVISTGNNHLGLAGFVYDGTPGNSHMAYFWKSKDGGDSWTRYEVGSAQYLYEPTWIETQTSSGSYTGGMYMLFRKEQSGNQYLLKTLSSDYGESWGNNTPDFDDKVIVNSELQCQEKEPAYLYRLADNTIICGYATKNIDYNAEIRIVKATSESTDLTWDSLANSALAWRNRNCTDGDSAYIALVELTDGGNIGMFFYYMSVSDAGGIIRFSWIYPEQFGISTWSYDAEVKIAYANTGIQIVDVTAGTSYVSFSTTTPTTYMIMFKVVTSNYGSDDQSRILAMNSSASHCLAMTNLPFVTNQSEAVYNLGGNGAYGHLSDYSEGTYYIFTYAINETSAKVNYYAYSSSWVLLGSAENIPYAWGSPTDCDKIWVGKGYTQCSIVANYDWLVIRKYNSVEPQHSVYSSIYRYYESVWWADEVPTFLGLAGIFLLVLSPSTMVYMYKKENFITGLFMCTSMAFIGLAFLLNWLYVS